VAIAAAECQSALAQAEQRLRLLEAEEGRIEELEEHARHAVAREVSTVGHVFYSTFLSGHK